MEAFYAVSAVLFIAITINIFVSHSRASKDAVSKMHHKIIQDNQTLKHDAEDTQKTQLHIQSDQFRSAEFMGKVSENTKAINSKLDSIEKTLDRGP